MLMPTMLQLDSTRELARHVPVAGEAAHAVDELVVGDDLHGRAKVGHAHAAQDLAKDLFLVDLHVGGDVVNQRAAQPEGDRRQCYALKNRRKEGKNRSLRQ